MHNIEPHYTWKRYYDSAEDERSPFFGLEYNEFEFTKQVYNYLIHPQWDEIGSPTLYLKLIFADYDTGFAVIEFIGEWNDCINNDIMYLKSEVIDHLRDQGIIKFLLIAENVMTFHSSDDSYYEEWRDDLGETGGWVIMLGLRDHVSEDMRQAHLDYYIDLGEGLADLNWRGLRPDELQAVLEQRQLNHTIGATKD